MYGQWTSIESDKASNYRDFHNLVITVEKLYEEGILKTVNSFCILITQLHTVFIIEGCHRQDYYFL